MTDHTTAQCVEDPSNISTVFPCTLNCIKGKVMSVLFARKHSVHNIFSSVIKESMQNKRFISAPYVKPYLLKGTASVSIQGFTWRNVQGLMNVLFAKKNLLHVMI
jgi:hypothetical protein